MKDMKIVPLTDVTTCLDSSSVLFCKLRSPPSLPIPFSTFPGLLLVSVKDFLSLPLVVGDEGAALVDVLAFLFRLTTGWLVGADSASMKSELSNTATTAAKKMF